MVGSARPGESYLVMDRIIEAATSTGCEAIHPRHGTGCVETLIRFPASLTMGPVPSDEILAGSFQGGRFHFVIITVIVHRGMQNTCYTGALVNAY